MGTYRLSESGKKQVEKAIEKKLRLWKIENAIQREINCKFSQEATRKILKKECKHYKNQTGWNFKYLASFINKKQVLNPKTLTNLIAEYPQFVSEEKQLNLEEIEKSINDNLIQGDGVSSETIRRFRQGKEINTKSFEVFCQVLNVSCDKVRENNNEYQNPEKLDRQQKLNAALRKLDHKKQRLLFKQFIARTNNNSLAICFKRQQSRKNGIHWLIKSLIQETNNNCNYEIIEFDALVRFTKKRSRNSYENLADELARDLVKKLKKNRIKKIFKDNNISLNITKNSTLVEIGEILDNLLKLYHIIFVFKDIDKVDDRTVDSILKGFWNVLMRPLARSVSQGSRNCFLICLIVNKELKYSSVSEYSETWKPLKPINLEVPIEFSFRELGGWIEFNDDIRRLFDFSSIDCEQNTLNRIWEKSRNGNSQAMLEAIYQECGCNLEQDYTWREL